MDRRQWIGREVEETLRSFDRKASLQARPDFYARVQARIRQTEASRPDQGAPRLRVRVLVPAALALFIVLNVITAVLAFRKGNPGPAGRQRLMTTLAHEYDLLPGIESSYWK